jgi:hypothetical protein
MPDKFPEAFDRFEDTMGENEMAGIQDFEDLFFKFSSWGGKRATMSSKQSKALAVEGRDRLGLEPVINEKKLVKFEKKFTLKDGTVRIHEVNAWRDLKTGRWTKLSNK